MGPEHLHTLGTRMGLARWRTAAGEPARAATELTELLADEEELLGPNQPALPATRAALADALDAAPRTPPDLRGSRAAPGQRVSNESRAVKW
ncbi:hypothetical protein Snoj_27700 [Streptomyces nojiriensis]|uniref:Tetratricopeptide repeat protein n=1 Tax=Streptomyces nojiriensis TaxID=66374 RepID=A0ABQ3SLK4_9ACTN|nr:hypothetical protein [Streptomyces nojiriensis]QTI42451.1 hypothetical protein JYK04_00209 [Streptomyces nojiriensis]GGS40031.1 hypothetical protein GCM10010205_82020 [Streptomyces nojiriensis]GHI68852.1 hypothetical protein Snoj_27700 [Streptomyces nojiriensis]